MTAILSRPQCVKQLFHMEAISVRDGLAIIIHKALQQQMKDINQIELELKCVGNYGMLC